MSRRQKFNGFQRKTLHSEAGLNLKEFGSQISLSCETVSAIKNDKAERMTSSSADFVKKCWSVSGQKASQPSRESCFVDVRHFCGFDQH